MSKNFLAHCRRWILTGLFMGPILSSHAGHFFLQEPVHTCAGRVWWRLPGHALTDSVPAVGVTVQSTTGDATTTDSLGVFRLISRGVPGQLIIRSVGYRELRLDVGAGGCQNLSVTLRPEVVELHGINIESQWAPSGGAPVEAQTIDARQIERLNAGNLGEALPFMPGVRVENNCQTCGYSQVRLNGLAGQYTQILIDRQSVLGGLHSAYGLDHLPAALIDRIEVIRGGGSAAYAANAVGGVVNVVTRRIQEPGWGALMQTSVLSRSGAGDHLWRAHADIVRQKAAGAKRLDSLLSSTTAVVFLNHRLRGPHDHDGDGFSEVARLRGTSAGLFLEHRLSKSWSIRVNCLAIDEDRRGGSDWHVRAPAARLAEEILQRSVSSHLEAGYRPARGHREVQLFLSQQTARRKAFYGGTGDSLPPLLPGGGSGGGGGGSGSGGGGVGGAGVWGGTMGVWTSWRDGSTTDYGHSIETTHQGGFRWHERLYRGWRLMAGSELVVRKLSDALPVAVRIVGQRLFTWSRFVQLDGPLHPDWRVHLGWRNDGVEMSGLFSQDTGRVLLNYRGMPGIWRGSIRWQPTAGRIALSLIRSGGYRAPQVFSEDLHVELVGGDVRIVQWSPFLNEERAVAHTFLMEFSPGMGGSNTRLTAELFQTHLMRPLLKNDLDTGVNGLPVWQKANGPDARIVGAVVGSSGTSPGGDWSWDASFGLQNGLYDKAVRLAPGPDGGLSSRELLRLPSWNGFVTLRRDLQRGWWLQYNYQHSGPMSTTRTDANTRDALILVRTPAMGQHDVWVEKLWKLNSRLRLAAELGCLNCANRFQSDLSRGPFRDASYVYGPSQPRRFSLRLRLLG